MLSNITEECLQQVDAFAHHGQSLRLLRRPGLVSRSSRGTFLKHAVIGRQAIPAVAGIIDVRVLR